MPKPLRMRSHRSSGGTVRSTGLTVSVAPSTTSVALGKGMGSALPGLMPGVVRAAGSAGRRAAGRSPGRAPGLAVAPGSGSALSSVTTPVAAQPARVAAASAISERRSRDAMKDGIVAQKPNLEC